MFDAIYSEPLFINQTMVYQLIRVGKDIGEVRLLKGVKGC